MNTDTWALFLYSMKSPVTKKKYCKRLDKFLLSLGLDGKSTEERARAFAEKGKDTEWTFHSVLQFMQAEKERVERKEVTAATIRNFVKCIKLYCEVCRILIDWKTITRGLPQAKRYGNDRAPISMEEVKRSLQGANRIGRSYLLKGLNEHQLAIYDILKRKQRMPSKELYDEYCKAVSNAVGARWYRSYMESMVELGLAKAEGNGRWKIYEINS